MPETKAFLKEHFEEPLTLTPLEGQRAVQFRGRVQIGGILEGIAGGHNPASSNGVPGGRWGKCIQSAGC